MSLGCIPILNYAEYLHPPLTPNINCICYRDVNDLPAIINRVLNMSPEQIAVMRKKVLRYYNEHLDVSAVVNNLLKNDYEIVLLNAEYQSVKLKKNINLAKEIPI